MIKFLESYPFKNLGVTIAEEFSVYDGNLRDVPGKPHGGIDYVLKKNGEFASFEVYTMFEGHARFGVSGSWGKYFVISKFLDKFQYDCVYAHLDNITEEIQKYAIIQGDKDFIIPSGYCLGWTGTTGNTKNIRQLHLELHEKNLLTGERRKLDPYGVYDRLASNKYPQPGKSLRGLNHFWVSDEPKFAK